MDQLGGAHLFWSLQLDDPNPRQRKCEGLEDGSYLKLWSNTRDEFISTTNVSTPCSSFFTQKITQMSTSNVESGAYSHVDMKNVIFDVLKKYLFFGRNIYDKFCLTILKKYPMFWRNISFAGHENFIASSKGIFFWCTRTHTHTHTHTLTYADVCWHMLTYADVCWRMLTYADVCWSIVRLGDVALLIGVFIGTQTFSVPPSSCKALSSGWARSAHTAADRGKRDREVV